MTTNTFEFQELEDNFNSALTTNNTNNIEPYLSEEWFMLEPTFGLISKESFLSAIEQETYHIPP